MSELTSHHVEGLQVFVTATKLNNILKVYNIYPQNIQTEFITLKAFLLATRGIAKLRSDSYDIMLHHNKS